MPRNPWRHTKNIAGYRPDLGFATRSALEADTARYLNALVERHAILAYEYEPKTLKFEHKTKGKVGYIPDFIITHTDLREEIIECKGKLDPTSRMKIRLAREAGYKVTLLRRKKLESLKKRDKVTDPNWEFRRTRRRRRTSSRSRKS